MKNKVLFVATTGTHINTFHLPYIEWFQERGYLVHVACKGADKVNACDKVWEVPFARSPFRKDNITAYKTLRSIIDKEQYALVHCHTPMGGVIARLAARQSRKRSGTKVLYTAHGFHFYNGAPLKNWLSFFPAEWALAGFTDCMLTINREDYAALQKFRFPCAFRVPTNGVGIDRKRIKMNQEIGKVEARKALGFAQDELVILYIAEFIPRKNHQFVFECIPQILREHPNAKFVFAGGKAVTGAHMEAYAKQHGFLNSVRFAGFTKDIGQYILAADLGISASLSEGLGLGLAELMCMGVPVILSQIRGHNELVKDGYNGYFFGLHDKSRFINAVSELCSNQVLREKMSKNGQEYMERFMLANTLPQTTAAYEQVLGLGAASPGKVA